MDNKHNETLTKLLIEYANGYVTDEYSLADFMLINDISDDAFLNLKSHHPHEIAKIEAKMRLNLARRLLKTGISMAEIKGIELFLANFSAQKTQNSTININFVKENRELKMKKDAKFKP